MDITITDLDNQVMGVVYDTITDLDNQVMGVVYDTITDLDNQVMGVVYDTITDLDNQVMGVVYDTITDLDNQVMGVVYDTIIAVIIITQFHYLDICYVYCVAIVSRWCEPGINDGFIGRLFCSSLSVALHT